MSITREDILALSNRQEQMSMFEYWSEDNEQQHQDHVGKTPLEMVKEFQEVTQQKSYPSLYVLLAQEEFMEWEEEGFVKGQKDLKELTDLVYVLYGYANAMGYNLDEAVRRVHENNMGRMYQPDGTIKRREDGKILKNEEYPKVDLGDLV